MERHDDNTTKTITLTCHHLPFKACTPDFWLKLRLQQAGHGSMLRRLEQGHLLIVPSFLDTVPWLRRLGAISSESKGIDTCPAARAEGENRCTGISKKY